jgi:gliding motility-associated-like protein
MEESICGGVYDENGFYQEESGLYTQHLQTEYGCDSIVNLDLTIFNLFVDTLNITIYEGDAYEYHGFNETQEGEYIRVFTDENGCDSIYVLNLHVTHLMIPNMVSANGDGINDVFEIKGLLNNDYFYFVELSIYNRHGRVIYYKNEFYNKEDFWSPEETDSPDGTYFYKFRAMGKTKIIERAGAIEVLR